MEDLNTPEYLLKIQEQLCANLDRIEEAPSVQFHDAGRDHPARPSPIPSPRTRFTRAGIEWRRCHRAARVAGSCQEHHRSVRAGP